MAVRTFLHYALEVPDQTVGQRFYEDFGLVDGTGRSHVGRIGREEDRRSRILGDDVPAGGEVILHRLLVRRIHIFHVQVKRLRWRHPRRWCRGHPRKLVSQKQHGIADLQLGVHDPSVRACHTAMLGRPERFLVQLDCLRRILAG